LDVYASKYSSDQIGPIFFDPYGALSEKEICGYWKKLPYTEKDVQSLMNNACGYYCAAFLHYINKWEHRTKDLYADVDMYLHYFDDLNKSIDWKKNEYILKMFFRSSDPALRKEIDVIGHPDHIT